MADGVKNKDRDIIIYDSGNWSNNFIKFIIPVIKQYFNIVWKVK